MIEMNRVYRGYHRNKPAKRFVGLIAHGVVYFRDKEQLPEHQIVERCSVKTFTRWLKRNNLAKEKTL